MGTPALEDVNSAIEWMAEVEKISKYLAEMASDLDSELQNSVTLPGDCLNIIKYYKALHFPEAEEQPPTRPDMTALGHQLIWINTVCAFSMSMHGKLSRELNTIAFILNEFNNIKEIEDAIPGSTLVHSKNNSSN